MSTNKACMPSIFIKTSQKKFYMKAVRCQLSPKACKKKELDFSDLSLKKIRKVLRKIEEMADFFLNSSNFAKRTFFTSLAAML